MSDAIRAVVFDLGKVLLDFDYGILIEKIARDCALSVEQLHQLINQSPLLFEFETGAITSEQFFGHVKQQASFRGEQTDFVRHFGDIFTPIPSMIQLNSEFRKLGLRTYIFSNTNEIAIGHVRRQFSFFKDFDGYFLSYEERLMKPEPKLYERVQQRIGARPNEILYIDDRWENIETGKQLNWVSILHVSPETTRETASVHLGRDLAED